MSWSLSIPAIDQALAYIAANQTAKLADVASRSEYAAKPVTLRDFQALRLSDPDRESVAAFPVLFMVPDGIGLDPGPAGLRRGWIGTASIRAYIIVVHPGSSSTTPAEMVARSIEMYTVAVLELLCESWNGTTRPYEFGTGIPTTVDYGAIGFNRSDNEYLGTGLINIGVVLRQGALT